MIMTSSQPMLMNWPPLNHILNLVSDMPIEAFGHPSFGILRLVHVGESVGRAKVHQVFQGDEIRP